MDVAIVIVYLAAMIAFGFWGKRRATTRSDFLVAGRRLGPLLYSGTMAAIVLFRRLLPALRRGRGRDRHGGQGDPADARLARRRVRLGRRGHDAARARRAGAGRRAGGGHVHLQRCAHRLCPGYPFGPYRIDLAFPAAKVAVEVDGWAWRVDPLRFRADRRKGNATTRATWGLLKFTWHDLDGSPKETVVDISETLALAA